MIGAVWMLAFGLVSVSIMMMVLMHELKHANERALERGEKLLLEMEELDHLRGELARIVEARTQDDKLIAQLRKALDAATKELEDVRLETVVDAPPGDVGGVVDRVLGRRAAGAGPAADHRDSAADHVPRPGSAASAPVPDSAFR